MPLAVAFLFPLSLAGGDAAGQDLRGVPRMSVIIESYAMGAAAGVVGAFTPNFVGAALASAWQAQAVSLSTKQVTEQAPLRAQMSVEILANVGELGQAMQANPRFARLVELGMSKRCEPPADAQK